MFAFVAYAVVVWYASARWRRRWPSFLANFAGFAGLVFIAWMHYRLHIWSHGQIYLPVLQVLLYPYTLLVVGVGLFIAFLPRPPIAWAHCPGCAYDLRGLDLPVESCPECGMTEELARFIGGRNFHGFPALPPPPKNKPRPSRAAPATAPQGPGPIPAAPPWPAGAAVRACLDPANE